MAFTIRVPRGVVCGITSFNSPLNMVAHKVAPALASGNTVVFKPPQATPLIGDAAVRAAARGRPAAGAPESGARPRAARSARLAGRSNPGIDFYSFTGSTPVGKQHPRRASGCGRSRWSSAASPATIVCEDADLDQARPRAASQSGFRRAGPGLHLDPAPVRPARRARRRSCRGCSQAARALKVGDPQDRHTDDRPDDQREGRRARRGLGRRGRRRRARACCSAARATAR